MPVSMSVTVLATLAAAWGACAVPPVPSPASSGVTERHPLTYTVRSTTTKPTTTFGVPSPNNAPAPSMNPSPLHFSNPAPVPFPSPGPLPDSSTFPAEPAPAVTLEPLIMCEQTCQGKTCDDFVELSCADLEAAPHMCDCAGCKCESSCANMCSGINPDCSCEATCMDAGNCCSDFSDMCTDFDFSAVGDDGTSNIVGIVVGVGVVLLIVGSVGGFLIARKVLVNSKIARQTHLLKQGNANLDTGSYSSPTLRSTRAATQGHAAPPTSEFGFL